MASKTIWLFGALVLLGALAVLRWPLSEPLPVSGSGHVQTVAPHPTAPGPLAEPASLAKAAKQAPTKRDGIAVEAPIPRALAGSQPDGEVLSDPQGHLRVTHGLRDLFDYFLMGDGEEPQATVTARVKQQICTQVEPPAQQEAQALFEQYLRYRGQAASLLQQDESADAPASRFEAIKTLRRRYLGAEVADTFFADEEAQTDLALRSREILADTTLSESERTELLQQLKASAPIALRISENMAMSPLRELQAIEEHAQGGVAASQIHAERVRAFGAAATYRLESLDAQSAAWEARLHDYLQRRQKIVENGGLGQTQRAQQIAQLRAQLFTTAEALRLDAFESRHAQNK